MGARRVTLARNKRCRGFSLIETLVAMSLVGIAMNGLVVTFVASGQFGVLARRQATAVAVARSIAVTLSHAPYADARLANSNANNDIAFADPDGLFARAAFPTGNDAPDGSLGNVSVGDESFETYVNVAPQLDPANAAVEQGRQFAVIVRYHVGSKYMRAVAIGYRYNPAVVGVGTLPL